MAIGKSTKPASLPYRAADHLKNQAEIAEYIEAMLADGDARAVPVALRTIADAVGGMAELAEQTGLSRETLYRTLSERGNPRLDTLPPSLLLSVCGCRCRRVGLVNVGVHTLDRSCHCLAAIELEVVWLQFFESALVVISPLIATMRRCASSRSSRFT